MSDAAQSTLLGPLTPHASCFETDVDASWRDSANSLQNERRNDLLRVLHVVNGEHYSGAERVQDLLAGSLPAHGYEVGFACVKPGRFPQTRIHREAPLYLLPMRSRLQWTTARRIAQLVRAENYALIHAHTPRSLLIGSLAARLCDVPLIYHVHSPAGRDSTRWLRNCINVWLERRTAHRAARLIAVSPSVRRYMIEQGFRANQVICVPNGVPHNRALARTIAPQTWTIGVTALFRPRKGVEVLLEALAHVREAGVSAQLRAIGPFESTAYETTVKRLAASLGVDDCVRWTGFVTDVSAELSKIDVLALPSLFGEGLPMVVLEALAAGVPVVASNVEGVPEAVRHGQEGLLVEPGDPRALADALIALAQGGHADELDYATLSARAKRRHAEHFSADLMAQRCSAIYDAVLGKNA